LIVCPPRVREIRPGSAVAAKGFDSTGSKLTDAVREIEEMADVRQARQFIMAVIDGRGDGRRPPSQAIHHGGHRRIGWKNRKAGAQAERLGREPAGGSERARA